MLAGKTTQPRRWRFAPYLILAALLTLLVACGSDAGAQDFGNPVPGQRVYDRSGTLSAAEIRDLEDRAAAVTAAGAPTVVFLRAQDADDEETQRDARDLAEAWGVESAPGARDGVVIFLNLDPDDTRHGQAAIFAGERHYDGGNLPQRELERIFEDEMRPLLADEQLTAGITAGLNALAQSLTVGPPPAPAPSTAQRTAGELARLPLNLLAILAAGGSLLLATRAWQSRTAPAAVGVPTLNRPGNLAPALTGALVARRINTPQLAEATLFDLARRGALVVEPEGRRSAQIRPLNAAVLAAGHEQQLWSALASSVSTDGTISGKALGKVLAQPAGFQEALHTDLVARGWFDPNAGAHRRLPYIVGTVSIVAAAIVGVITAIGKEPWGLLAAGIFLVSGVVLLSIGYSLPETTAQGERTAAPWHAYRAGLAQAGRDTNHPLGLDAALPDATALGVIAKLDKRLKEASNAGYAPAWFVRPDTSSPHVGFYPVWIALHSTASSSSSSTSSGASTGGGTAGGSF